MILMVLERSSSHSTGGLIIPVAATFLLPQSSFRRYPLAEQQLVHRDRSNCNAISYTTVEFIPASCKCTSTLPSSCLQHLQIQLFQADPALNEAGLARAAQSHSLLCSSLHMRGKVLSPEVMLRSVVVIMMARIVCEEVAPDNQLPDTDAFKTRFSRKFTGQVFM
ncbi:hypothetical protein ABBQ38_002311 [Trebouxia sp. C0009 RCD-2024]